jgi:regulator of protease activity HflC (stomatin/prohibitin superfamily)
MEPEGVGGPRRAAPQGRPSSTDGTPIPWALVPFVLAALFMKVPPNKALLVRSKRGERRILRVVLGGSDTVNPLTEEAELLETGVRTLEHVFEGVRTSDGGGGLPIDVRASLNVTILTSRGLTPERAELLLKLPAETFNAMVVEAVGKRLREACASCTAEDLATNRQMVAGWVLRAAARDLEPVGVDLRAFAIRELEDEHGYLDAVRADMMQEYLDELEEQRARQGRKSGAPLPPPAGPIIAHKQTVMQYHSSVEEREAGLAVKEARPTGRVCPDCHRPFTPEEARALAVCPRCGLELTPRDGDKAG